MLFLPSLNEILLENKRMPLQNNSFKNVYSWRRNVTCRPYFILSLVEGDVVRRKGESASGLDGGDLYFDGGETDGSGKEICYEEFDGEAVLVFAMDCSCPYLKGKIVLKTILQSYLVSTSIEDVGVPKLDFRRSASSSSTYTLPSIWLISVRLRRSLRRMLIWPATSLVRSRHCAYNLMIAQSTEVQPLSAEVMDSCLRRVVTFLYCF
jgi:hypothetical protein